MGGHFIEINTPQQKKDFAEALMVTLDLQLSAEMDLVVAMRNVIHPININPISISEIADFIRRKGKYEVIEAGGLGTATHTFIIRKKPKKSWTERHPALDKWRTGFITFLFSLTTGVLLFLIANRRQGQADSQQNKRLDKIDSVINNLQKNILDYEKALKTSDVSDSSRK